MASNSVTLELDAAPEDVWRVTGERWDLVFRLVPRISQSELLSDGVVEEGAVRQCTLSTPAAGMREIEERLVAYDPPRSFSYAVLDPPFPLRRLVNTWTIEASNGGTRLTLRPTVELQGGPLAGRLEGLVLWQLLRELESDVGSMTQAIERAAHKTTA